MRNQPLYMNNSGSRWTYREREPRRFYIKVGSDYFLRHAEFFSGFGNFVAYHFKINGKRYAGLPSDTETHKGLPIIDISKVI